MTKRTIVALLFVAIALSSAGYAHAQSLKFKIERIFDETLRLQLGGSPDEHGQHFSPNNVSSSAQMISALTNFIGTNVSAFPLASAAASVTFDLSTGTPVRETSSLGPIFTERAATLGAGQSILGYSFTHMQFSQIRGVNTKDLRFTFSHEDVGSPGLGDSDNELDNIDLFMDMEMEASIIVFQFSYGVTNDLDISFGVPMVNVRLDTQPLAHINSFTFVSNDSANHFFDGTQVDPVLTTRPTPIGDDATGIGDVAIQAKYNFHRGDRLAVAGLVGARLATGDEENFLGAGDPSFRVGLVASGRAANAAPHVNIAYEFRTSDLDKDELDIFLGYDQKLSDKLTLALDFLGEFEVGSDIDELAFQESVTISRPVSQGEYRQVLSLTNLPQTNSDHLVNGSVGFKLAPRDFVVVVANALVPLNSGGLRPDVMGTLGFEFNF